MPRKDSGWGDWFRELVTLRPGRSAKGARKWRKLASLRQCGHLFATLISRAKSCYAPCTSLPTRCPFGADDG